MKIIQIIPTARPIVAVYGEHGKVDWINNVDYLALADDGTVYGLDLALDGFYDVCDAGNFVGLCEVGDIYRFLEANNLTQINTDPAGMRVPVHL